MTQPKPRSPAPETEAVCSILVLCTGNSARSIMAEALFNRAADGRFRASSAGSRPTGQVNPLALEQIHQLGLATESYRSKHWQEFLQEGELAFDIVLTVCDNAAADACPFLRDCEHVHWSLPDPAAVRGDIAVQREAFANCFNTLRHRIEALTDTVDDDTDGHQFALAMRTLEPHKGM